MKTANPDDSGLLFRTTLLIATALGISCMSPLFVQSNEAKEMQTFLLHFIEGTGNTYTIDMKDASLEITFDETKSDPEALLTLRNLKAEVLYPNAENKIKLQGWLDEDKRVFVLKHWYLSKDFIRVHFAESASEVSVETNPGKLTSDDFTINVRAKVPTFTEQKYLRAIVQANDQSHGNR